MGARIVTKKIAKEICELNKGEPGLSKAIGNLINIYERDSRDSILKSKKYSGLGYIGLETTYNGHAYRIVIAKDGSQVIAVGSRENIEKVIKNIKK
jgi:hypothetical protein